MKHWKWCGLLVIPLLLGAQPPEKPPDPSLCTVAREVAIKGVFLYGQQADQGLAALEKAHQTCSTEFGITFNLGLAHYLSGHMEKASQLWGGLHRTHPQHEKTLTNLAWVQFELGNDDEANKLATKGLVTYPKSMALAHTRVFSLFRLGRYLDAYDWLMHSGLSGVQVDQWRQRAANYVVETEWRKFRASDQIQAIRQAVNLLVRWYPDESIFIDAKDRLLLAHLDKNASVPYPLDLPHEMWKKTGNVDDQSVILDERIAALPPVADWEKRRDAFAVVVGIDRYKRLRARHFAERDASNVHKLLVGRGVLLGDVDHLRSRINQEATREVLADDLQWLVRQGQLDANATLIFYFAGLGVSLGGDMLLVPVEAGFQELGPSTTISLSALKTALEKLPNQNVIVILDTCFNDTPECAVYDVTAKAATSVKGDTTRIAPTPAFFQGRHAWIVAALQQGASLHGPGRQGSLTYYMLKGLLGEGDGADGTAPDGWVDATEAFAFAKENMRSQKVDLFLSRPSKVRLTLTAGEK